MQGWDGLSGFEGLRRYEIQRNHNLYCKRRHTCCDDGLDDVLASCSRLAAGAVTGCFWLFRDDRREEVVFTRIYRPLFTARLSLEANGEIGVRHVMYVWREVKGTDKGASVDRLEDVARELVLAQLLDD